MALIIVAPLQCSCNMKSNLNLLNIKGPPCAPRSEELRVPFCVLGFPGGSDGKASARNVGDPGSIPGLERSPGEENGNPLQHSCLENPMDGGA